MTKKKKIISIQEWQLKQLKEFYNSQKEVDQSEFSYHDQSGHRHRCFSQPLREIQQ